MERLIKDQLRELNISPSKRLGQNFIKDSVYLEKIVEFAELTINSAVVEIGPGLGALTRRLLDITKNFLAVEIDRRLVDYLVSKFTLIREEQLLCADILGLSAKLCAELLQVDKITVVSNVPYSISSELIVWVLNNRVSINGASFLLQKEFAERLAASPGGRDYGSLSVFSQMYAEIELGPVVPGTAFFPRANVDSQVIKIIPRVKPLHPVDDPILLQKIVRAAFSHRRKTLLNSLSQGLGIPKGFLEELLNELNISPQRRAETLSLQEYFDLYTALKKVAF